MEQLLIDHPGAVVALVASAMTTIGPLIYWLGRLSVRIDKHDQAISDLEEGKVDRAYCKATHAGLNLEIKGIHDDVRELRG